MYDWVIKNYKPALRRFYIARLRSSSEPDQDIFPIEHVGEKFLFDKFEDGPDVHIEVKSPKPGRYFIMA